MTKKTTLTAKPVVQNRFWIVEEDGAKIATIQAGDGGRFILANQSSRVSFSNLRQLQDRYGIRFEVHVDEPCAEDDGDQVYGYPTHCKPYNRLYNAVKKVPVYTATLESKSFFCAGYYLVTKGKTQVIEFCPKLIMLNRKTYTGPFATKEEITLAKDGPINILVDNE